MNITLLMKMDYEHHFTYENGWSWLMGYENEASNN